MDDEPVLDMRGVTKAYGDARVLHDVSLSLRRGDRTVVLGHNGAGKSTLLEIVATLRRPTSGTVRVCGIDTRSAGARARRLIGLAPQANGLDGAATPRETLRFHGVCLGMRRVEAAARAEELLEQFGLREDGSRAIDKLSGGGRRKVDLAVALVGAPALVILDEPTTGLDPVARKAFWEVLTQLTEGPGACTLLVSTQDLHEAEALATQILVLREGHAVAHDTPAQLKRRVGERALTMAMASAEAARELAANLARSHEARASNLAVTMPIGGHSDHLAAALAAAAGRAEVIDELHLTAPTIDDVFLALAAR